MSSKKKENTVLASPHNLFYKHAYGDKHHLRNFLTASSKKLSQHAWSELSMSAHIHHCISAIMYPSQHHRNLQLYNKKETCNIQDFWIITSPNLYSFDGLKIFPQIVIQASFFSCLPQQYNPQKPILL